MSAPINTYYSLMSICFSPETSREEKEEVAALMNLFRAKLAPPPVPYTICIDENIFDRGLTAAQALQFGKVVTHERLTAQKMKELLPADDISVLNACHVYLQRQKETIELQKKRGS